MKVFTGIIAAIILLVVPFGISAEAAAIGDSSGIMPMFDYIENAGCTLIITESGKATFSSDINGDYKEVLMIEIYVKLQKKSGSTWKDIATNSTVAYDYFGCCEGTYYLTERGVYRTETTFTVYTANDMETTVSHSSEKTY